MTKVLEKKAIELFNQGSLKEAEFIIKKILFKDNTNLTCQILNNNIQFSNSKNVEFIKKNIELSERLDGDSDQLTLLTEFFRELGLDEEIKRMYETLTNKEPQKINILFEWFMSNIEEYDGEKYFKIFKKMNKSEPENRTYAYWCSMAFLIQCRKVKIENESDVSKYAKTGLEFLNDSIGIEDIQELYVYTKLTKYLNLHEKGVYAIEKFQKGLNNELEKVYLNELISCEKYEKAFEYVKKLIFDENKNDFELCKKLIEIGKILKLPLKKVKDFFNAKPYDRNFLLSQIEAMIFYEENIQDQFLRFYKTFRSKIFCTFDLHKYLKQLDAEIINNYISDSNLQLIDKQDHSFEELITLINNQKMLFYINKEQSSFNISEFNKLNWKIFEIHKNTVLNKTTTLQNIHASDLLLFTFILSLNQNSSIENIIKNIINIHYCLKYDPQNFKSKLWLIKMYSNLCFSSLLPSQFEDMNLKMIQYEIMYQYFSMLNPSIHNLLMLINIHKFFLISEEETKKSVLNGFVSGVYNKLESFVSFGFRLKFSFSKIANIAKILKFSFILSEHKYLTHFIDYFTKHQANLMNIENFVDNRDFKTEWKFSSQDNGIYNKDLLNSPYNCLTSNLLKFNIIKYLLIFETNNDKIAHLFKLLNKITFDSNKFNKIDLFFIKLTCNILKLFKYYHKIKESEVITILNYFKKNLKLSKIRSNLFPTNIIFWETNYVLIEVVELIKIALYLYENKTFFNKNFDVCISIFNKLTSQIKEMNMVQLQLENFERLRNNISKEHLDLNTFDTVYEIIVNSFEKTFSYLNLL